MLERDSITGLDHTWWRKYESFSGRLTTPDPYGGSMNTADPQSFNRYSYVQNDPVNFLDPSGLCTFYINLTGTANVSAEALAAMKAEIERIFTQANQTATFDPGQSGAISIIVGTLLSQFSLMTLHFILKDSPPSKAMVFTVSLTLRARW
jgi:RHS repeat-associated protein